MSPNPASREQEIAILKPAEEFKGKSGKDILATRTILDITRRRNFKMTRRFFEDFGFTPGCVGCEAIDEGLPRRTHSKYCRERIAQELGKSEEGRQVLKNVSDRFRATQGKNSDIVEPTHEATSSSVNDDGLEFFAHERLDEIDSFEDSGPEPNSVDDSGVLVWSRHCKWVA